VPVAGVPAPFCFWTNAVPWAATGAGPSMINGLKSFMGNGYSVLLAVCSAICPAAFGHVLPICIGQNILVNESIFFMPFILFFVRMVDIFHSITNEWAKFHTKDMFFFYFFIHASPTSTT
jgi:hypothetical protein